MSDFTVISDTNPLYAEIEQLKRERDALAEALRDTLRICISRGEKLGLDDGGPVLDKARNALAQVRK